MRVRGNFREICARIWFWNLCQLFKAYDFSPLQMHSQKTTKLTARVQYWKARKLGRGQDIAGAQQSSRSGGQERSPLKFLQVRP